MNNSSSQMNQSVKLDYIRAIYNCEKENIPKLYSNNRKNKGFL